MTRPNHQPPGNASPRFIDLRTGGNLPREPRKWAWRLAFLAAGIAAGILATPAKADLTPDRLAILIGSNHIGATQDFDEFNPGVIAVWEGEHVNTRAGVYHNSLGSTSVIGTFTSDYLTLEAGSFTATPFIGAAYYPGTGRHEAVSIGGSDWIAMGGIEFTHDSGVFVQVIPGDGAHFDALVTAGWFFEIGGE